MKFKALIAAPIVAWLMIASAATIERPLDWSSSSSTSPGYQAGVDSTVVWNGKPALTLLGTGQTPAAFGDIHQWVGGWGYGGKRVRFSGMLRTSAVDLWAGVYINTGMFSPRAMPSGVGKRGTNAQWQPVSVVIDVPQDVETIRMGLILVGNGQAWLSDLKFEEVGSEVPVTTSKVEIDLAHMLREHEYRLQQAKSQPKSMPANLELRIK
ncbi:MAG: hypothetical protein WCH44_08620 [Betaproteobacteria bacterium]